MAERSPSPELIYGSLQAEGKLLEVGMNEVRALKMHDEREIAIGAEVWKYSTVIAILGDAAVLIAHINPGPGQAFATPEEDAESRQDNLEHVLLQLRDQFHLDQNLYPSVTTEAWCIFGAGSQGYGDHDPGVFEGSIRDALRQMGIEYVNITFRYAAGFGPGRDADATTDVLCAFVGESGYVQMYLDSDRVV